MLSLSQFHSMGDKPDATEGPPGEGLLCCRSDHIKADAWFITANTETEEFHFKLHWRHSCYCRHRLKKRPRCNSQTALSSIHPAFSSTLGWICLCKRSALLVIQGYNDSPTTVPPGTIKGHPFTGVTLTHRDTKTAGKLISSALPGAFKEIFHCGRTFYHLLHTP